MNFIVMSFTVSHLLASSAMSRPNHKTLQVTHFSSSRSEFLETLRKSAKYVKVNHKNTAFIEFEKLEDATAAFNGSQDKTITGTAITVTYASKDYNTIPHTSPLTSADIYFMRLYCPQQLLVHAYARRWNFISRSPTLRHAVQVFWDWENCGIPIWLHAKFMVRNIRIALGHSNLELLRIDGFRYPDQLSQANREVLEEESCLHLHDVVALTPAQRARGEADVAIRAAMLSHIVDNEPPAPCLVATGDKDYIKTILPMKRRHFDMYLASVDNLTGLEIRLAVKKTWIWSQFVKGHPPIVT